MSPPTHRALVDALAEVVHDPEEARLVALGAGFPRKDLPVFGTARVFWERVVEAIVDGKTEGGIDALVAEAAKLYPHNEVFAGRRPAAEGDGLGEASPSAPTASRFGAVDNRGASIGQQVIVQGNATFGSAAVGDEGGSSGSLGAWLRWPRSRRARPGLALLIGGLALALAVPMVSPGARQVVCGLPGIRSLCPEEISEAEQALWQRALETSSGDGLREYLRVYSGGVYVKEAQARLDGCRTESRIEWQQEETLRSERTVLPSSEPQASEEDARRDALARAHEDVAKNACVSYESSASFRLRDTAFEPTSWDCRPRGGGHACTVRGHAVCEVQRRKTVDEEVCNEARE